MLLAYSLLPRLPPSHRFVVRTIPAACFASSFTMVAGKSSAQQALTLFGAAPRPDAGNRQGRPVPLTTNLFKTTLAGNALKDVVLFSIVIEPIQDSARGAPGGRDTLPVSLNREIIKFALDDAARNAHHAITPEFARYLVYDGRALAYSFVPLGTDSVEWEINLPPKADLAPLAGAPGTAPPPRGAAPPGQARASDRRFKIKIAFARKIDMQLILDACCGDRHAIMATAANPTELIQDGIQALDILLRVGLHGRYQSGTSQAAMRKFYNPSSAIAISQGAEIWPGFFQSARPCAAGLVVNLDPAFSAFVGGGPFMEVAAKVLGIAGGGGGDFGGRGGRSGRGGGWGDRGGRGGRGAGRGGYGGGDFGGGGGAGRGGAAILTSLNQQDQRQLRMRLKNVAIRYTHRPSNKLESFQGFTPRGADQTEFTTRDGKTYTIAQYFLEKYNIRLRHPHLPCLRTGTQKSAVPMELCIVVPQGPIPATSLTPNQSADQIKVSAMRPDVRKRRVDEIRAEVAYDTDPMLRGWGVSVDQSPLRTEGRAIAPPEVSYGGQRARIRDGSWNLVHVKFLQPGDELITWGVLDYTNTPMHAIETFVVDQVQALKGLGVRVKTTEPLIMKQRPNFELVRQHMMELGKTVFLNAKQVVPPGQKPPAPQLFMVILDQMDQPFYNTIKRAAALELTTPVATQCINFRKASNIRGRPQYVANVGMKINVKLGGTNHVVSGEQDLPRFGRQTMLIGADVTHPGPGSDKPSIAGSVATIDGAAKRYSSELRTQTNPRGGSSQEVMLHSKGMMLGHLKRWQNANQGRLPDSIVFFRDGVSEGQYQSVLDHELAAIKAAAREIRPDAKIKVTFVVCGKRHHVRFFADKAQDTDAKTGNLPAGVCVDTGIVSPFGFDFYLQSQSGLVGTARPCHYVVLCNEMGFSSEHLIRCINSLCYTYCRATRSVSLVPPAYYADILCEKARAFVYGPDDGETVTSSEREQRGGVEEITEAESMKIMNHFKNNANFASCLWFM